MLVPPPARKLKKRHPLAQLSLWWQSEKLVLGTVFPLIWQAQLVVLPVCRVLFQPVKVMISA